MIQQNFRRRRKFLLLLFASTIAMLLSVVTLATATATATPNTNINNSSFDQIPGLYPHDNLITPIQGQDQFERLVKGVRAERGTDELDEHRMSLVQFYMATCPDCQGFSPYFRRFVQNIAPHWRRLVRVFVVNCNDDLNINLCWQENPFLVVPMVRWYTLPVLINSLNQPIRNGTTVRQLYDNRLISDNHRRSIEKQRRDLISLRHATLRFMASNVDQMEALNDEDAQEEKVIEDSPLSIYRSLKPIQWRHLQPLGREKQANNSTNQNRFSLEFEARQLECRRLIGEPKNREAILDFVVFERHNSYLGKTLVADWSNHSCSPNTDKLFMVHYSNELGLLGPSGFNLTEPQLYSIETKPIDIELKRVATSGQLNMRRRRALQPTTTTTTATQTNQQRLLQRMSLEQYYSKRRPGPTSHRHPANKDAKRRLPRMATQDEAEKAKKNKAQMEAENINWAPPELYSNEELLRYTFNRAIARRVLAADTNFEQQVAGWAGGDFGEIKMPRRAAQRVVAPKDEDLSLVSLTDYYKVLDEIVHKNLHQRAHVDGHQFLAAICFLDQLIRHFPFQGITRTGHKSAAQSHLERLQAAFIEKLETILNRDRNYASEMVDLSKVCSTRPFSLSEKDLSAMSAMNMSSKGLQGLETEVEQRYQTGIPDEGHFKWTYCAGSSPYLRGHTCSLWLLFHTLTVHEYLESNNTKIKDLEYSFVTPNASEYSIQTNQSCDPRQPEAALLSTSSRDLFVKAPQFVLANIINFVRYFMSCTNCAAHFSCMVERSMDRLDFERPKPGNHLLFLWEVHNRVNLRTKNTHSEDPNHPKHVFPTYEACPACYLAKPSDEQIQALGNPQQQDPH